MKYSPHEISSLVLLGFMGGIIALSLSGCSVGPDYKKPEIEVPQHFKEASKEWKIATPRDHIKRDDWWEVFKDPTINALITKLHKANQSLEVAAAQYRQALAQVNGANAGYGPTVNLGASITRQRPNPSLSSAKRTTTSNPININHSLAASASWEADVWGQVGRIVESSEAAAAASEATLANVKLSLEAQLVQIYFQIQTTDRLQKFLDDMVKAYEKVLNITQNRYQSGVADASSVLQSKAQLQTAKIQAQENKISRSQYEHAIAVLVGEPVAAFSIPNLADINTVLPEIPLDLPSTLLERRPDIAAVERQVAQANAEIGVATAGFFPSLNLVASGGFVSSTMAHWISMPARAWSLGPQLAMNLFDGGLQQSKEDSATAAYDATVAKYRQTVLTAFQDVEDNLVGLENLSKEDLLNSSAVADAQKAVDILMNKYKAGVVSYSEVLLAQVTAFNAQKTLITTQGRQQGFAVGLIKALGGGWKA